MMTWADPNAPWTIRTGSIVWLLGAVLGWEERQGLERVLLWILIAFGVARMNRLVYLFHAAASLLVLANLATAAVQLAGGDVPVGEILAGSDPVFLAFLVVLNLGALALLYCPKSLRALAQKFGAQARWIRP